LQGFLLIKTNINENFINTASFLFNHFNSWIGIAIAIGGVATSIYYLENKFKNQQKK